MAACIQETCALLQEAAPLWFNLFDNTSRAIHYLENVDVDSLLPDCVRVGPGSRGSLETLATLKFLQARANPTAENRQAVRDEAEKLFGAYLSFPSAIKSALMIQREVIRIGQLIGEDHPALGSPRFVAETDLKEAVKKQIWLFLKEHGFNKFTTRFACRTVGQVIQVIEVSPFVWAYQKPVDAPAAAFEVRLGLFWPLLSAHRQNKASTLVSMYQCQICSYLSMPGEQSTSAEAALACLREQGLPWLSVFEDPKSAMAILQKPDWDLYALMPMMRGVGAHRSAKRWLLLSFFAYLSHNPAEMAKYLDKAACAIEEKELSHHQDFYRAWYQGLRDLMRHSNLFGWLCNVYRFNSI